MINPLIGGKAQKPNPMSNFQQMMQQFNQFMQTFSGNPQEQVQQMMNSGKVTQEKLNWAHQQALDYQKQLQQFQKMMGGRQS